MSMVELPLILVLTPLGIIVLKDMALIVLFQWNFKSGTDEEQDTNSLPLVSVFVSARNEEMNIEDCVKSLQDQNYPVDKFEILVGNDQSTDTTGAILSGLQEQIPQLRVFEINETVIERPGKMNTLAQIVEFGSGQIFLFTDADTVQPREWLRTMVRQFSVNPNLGVVTGCTLLKTRNLFGSLQQIEWCHAIAMMKVVADTGVQVSSIGNNMAITRKAYRHVGGFSGIPFSVTEDYEIYRQICNLGYASSQLFEAPVLAWSKPQPGFRDLLVQRKRWMQGAIRLPWIMIGLLVLNGLVVPLVVTLLILELKIGLAVWAAHFIAQTSFIIQAYKKLGVNVSLVRLLAYEFYMGLVNLAVMLHYLFPDKIVWKGRKYPSG